MLRALSLCLCILSSALEAQEAKSGSKQPNANRVALVIGNGVYDRDEDRLFNPPNDAKAMSAKLRSLGFQVIEALDLDYRAMRTALRQFDRALHDADAGLFFYAGHGMEYQGRNYLFPTDAVLESEGDISLGLIDVSQVLHVMETRVPTRVLFLDACRNNPLARRFRTALGATRSSRVGTGLARIDAAVGTFIAYATAPGELAEDGNGTHSPFSAALLQHLDEPGLDVSQLMRRIRNTVLEETDERQVPWNSSSLRGSFVLNPVVTVEEKPKPEEIPPFDRDREDDKEAWAFAKQLGSVQAFEAYREGYCPGGRYCRFAEAAIASKTAAVHESSDASSEAGIKSSDGSSSEEQQTALDTPGKTPRDTIQPIVIEPLPSEIEKALGLDREERRELQFALLELGHDPRGLDGHLGPRSRAAITAWQKSEFKRETGYLTREQVTTLLDSLGPKLKKFRDRLRPGRILRDCGDCPDMVVVPSGSFDMGSYNNIDETPIHAVSVRSFAIGKYEITFAEWDACVASGGCNHQADDEGWGRGKIPAINVSWDDAQQYVVWLSKVTGKEYRLPTEAEWEYSARAGAKTPFSNGNKIATSEANFFGTFIPLEGSDQRGRGTFRQRTTSVGSFTANRFGLHDMHGNVWEWVMDRYHISYNNAPKDGRAWLAGTEQFGVTEQYRVIRGGSWANRPGELRAANRSRLVHSARNHYVGFRVARTLTP